MIWSRISCVGEKFVVDFLMNLLVNIPRADGSNPLVNLQMNGGLNRQLFTSLYTERHSQALVDQLASGTYRVKIESIQ